MNDAAISARWICPHSTCASPALLGTRTTDQRQFDITTGHASALVSVTDAAAIAALVELLAEEKLLSEPTTSCSIAALLAAKIPLTRGDNVLVFLCRANVDIERVGVWICEGADAHLTKPLTGK